MPLMGTSFRNNTNNGYQFSISAIKPVQPEGVTPNVEMKTFLMDQVCQVLSKAGHAMTALQSKTFLIRLFAAITLGICTFYMGIANAEVYKCKLKSGKIEMRDFPCEASFRLPPPNSQQTTRTTTSQNSAISSPNGSSQDFTNSAQHESAKSTCSRIMSKYDFTAPMMRCSLNDSNCFRLANQESSAIFNRLIAEPEWKRQQCDIVMQIESAAKTPSGCKSSQIVKPVPFLGTAEEVIVLSDGSVWKDTSYKYLYLYAYSPMIQICTAQSKMILEHGGTTHTFSLIRLQ